jgi:hypothetical protein
MNLRRTLDQLPWQKIVAGLAIAGVVAWSAGFIAGLVVRIVASYW